MVELQDSTPLFENPVFSVAELQDRFEIVSKKFIRLNSAVLPPELAKPAAKSENATAAGSADLESPQADTQSSESASEEVSETSTEPPHEELR
jgi:hypothetical protein